MLRTEGEYMLFLYGLLTAVVFFIVVISALYIGYKLGHKQGKPVEIDEKQIIKAKKIQEDFQKLMNYDVPTALQRKKVE